MIYSGHVVCFEYEPQRFEVAVATLNAVFDESGGVDRSHVIFAGLIAMPEQWEEMGIPWRSALRKHGLNYWRTVEAAHMNDSFKKFRKRPEELRTLALHLADLVCKHAGGGHVNSVSVEEFNQLKDTVRKRLRTPFYAAFESGIRTLMLEENIDIGDKFNLICDDSEESVECHRAYRSLRKQSPEIGKRIGGICFLDDKMYFPVQAADLYAFCHRKKIENDLKGIWAEVMARFDEIFSVQIPGDIIVK
jgi:hypothetical protein